MKTLLILIFSMVMAGEMTVDGSLTVADTLHVTTIHSATIDSLAQVIANQQQQISSKIAYGTRLDVDKVFSEKSDG